jgi:hypothetical protein
LFLPVREQATGTTGPELRPSASPEPRSLVASDSGHGLRPDPAHSTFVAVPCIQDDARHPRIVLY